MTDADTKTCPDCAEEIKAQALVCRYCGYRFADTATDPAPEIGPVGPDRTEPAVSDAEGPSVEPAPAPVADGTETKTSGRTWRITAYVAAAALWVLVAYPAGASVADTSSAGDIASGVLASVLVSFVVAAVIRWIYAKLRKRRFWSPWIFVLAAAIAVVSAAGQAAQ